MEIGEKIKSLRKEKGLSQEDLAGMLHVTRQAISKWESAKGSPDIGNIIQLSEIFQISLDELIRNNKKMKEKLIVDSASKKWHFLVIAYLFTILVYIAYFAAVHRILMLGFAVATVFMLGIELYIALRNRVFTKRLKE